MRLGISSLGLRVEGYIKARCARRDSTTAALRRSLVQGFGFRLEMPRARDPASQISLPVEGEGEGTVVKLGEWTFLCERTGVPRSQET